MKPNKIFLVLFIFGCLSAEIFAQQTDRSADEQEVLLLIEKLFDGMREGDSAKVSSVFGKDVLLYTSFNDKDGVAKVQKGELQSFLKAIGTPHDQVWNEKISNTKINIDGGMAQVWTDYSFYIDQEFSHCGVDAFHLMKGNDSGWKIVHLMDTRRKENCQIDQ